MSGRTANDAYTNGMEATLLIDINEYFRRGMRVRVVGVKTRNAPGVDDPLTAKNALYLIDGLVTRPVHNKEGRLVKSKLIPHFSLRDMHGAILQTRFFKAEELAYLAQAFEYHVSGEHYTLRRGDSVILGSAGLTMNTQSMARSINDAGYYFTRVTTTQETGREQAPMLLVHSELQSLVQAPGF